MKKSILYILLIIIIFYPIKKVFSQDDWYQKADERIDQIRKGNFTIKVVDENGNVISDSIKIQLVKHEFPFGNIFTAPADPWSIATLIKYFDAGIFPDLKWPYIEGTKGKVDYSSADKSIELAKKYGWELRGHTLLWGGDQSWQMPSWTLGNSMTSKELYDACRERIIRDVTYFKGKFKDYDVINEPTPGHASWLQSKVGDSINWNCFKWAREADPDAELIVNDYNTIEYDNDNANFKQVVKTMLANGAPVTGIGVQGHMGSPVDWKSIKKRIDNLAEFGLPIKVTEFDFNVDAEKISESAQAIGYATMLRIAFSHPAMNGFYFWGFCDRSMWRPGGGIFTEDLIPKPAADSVYDLIRNKWNTEINSKMTNDGTLQFRAFFGNYEVLVKSGNEYRLFNVAALKANQDQVLTLNWNEGKAPRPKLIKAILNQDPAIVELIFDKSIDAKTLKNEYFAVFETKPIEINQVGLKEGNSHIIQIKLKTPIVYRQYATVNHIDGNILAVDGGAMAWISSEEIENPIPGFRMAVTNEDGSQVEIKFSKAMSDKMPSASDFSLKYDDKSINVKSINLKSGDETTLVLTLEQKIYSGKNAFVSYNPGTFISKEGYKLAAFGPKWVEVKAVTGISKINQNIEVYPNPVVDKLIINNMSDSFLHGTIYQISGKQILSFVVNQSGKSEINTGTLPCGVYILKMYNNNGLIKTGKLIKM